jgi:hypothetical protein
MTRSEFLKSEYETLREEIKTSKNRMFTLAVGALVGIPSAYSFAEKTVAEKIDTHGLVFSLPLLICVITLLYLAETFTVMRAGRYIRLHIEPKIVDSTDPDFKGWEHWLEEYPRPLTKPSRRLVDRFVTSFFYVMFVFYYVVSATLAVNYATMRQFSNVALDAILSVYISVGILFVSFLLYSFTQTVGTGGHIK